MNVAPLCDDLLAERAALTSLLAPLDDEAWRTPTPAPGWTILDQVTHLAFFDESCRLALVDPDEFRAARQQALEDIDGFVDRATQAHRHLTGAQAREWLDHAGAELVAAASPVDGSTRVPWYGPDMSVASSITARIMETWAHGQDVADALGVQRVPTERLRHVAFIGARARPNSYAARGLPTPETPVRVELTGPDGDTWVFGPEDAVDVVRGPALDFCLVVTQRRHPDDTALTADGAMAGEWLGIAQAFAGPPGAGRQPGQFR
jgi:uncharacterized protein (TIGR03084 family)